MNIILCTEKPSFKNSLVSKTDDLYTYTNVIKNAISDLIQESYKLNTTKLIVYLDILKSHSYTYTFIYNMYRTSR